MNRSILRPITAVFALALIAGCAGAPKQSIATSKPIPQSWHEAAKKLCHGQQSEAYRMCIGLKTDKWARDYPERHNVLIGYTDSVEPDPSASDWEIDWDRTAEAGLTVAKYAAIAVVVVGVAMLIGEINEDMIESGFQPVKLGGAKTKRSSAQRSAFTRANRCPSTGKTSGSCPGYHVDHIVPLACGGADSPSNMQWLTASANLSKGSMGCRY